MPDKFRLIGKRGFLEAERFGIVYRIWEFETNNLRNTNIEIPVGEIEEFVAYWRGHGFPLLNAT